MALTQITEKGIKDGEIVNADVNASAAIAGSKLAAATTSVAGSMSAADKTKLDGVAASANNYTHPTSNGNKHIPADGSAGQFLKYDSAGTAVWAADNDTVYTHPNHSGDVTSSGDGATTIADNAVTLAKMAGLARGKLIYGDASGDPAALTVGSANQVLTSDGTDVAWAAAAAGGLTEADMWRIHSETAGGNSPQTTNWERADTGGFSHLGTGLSESSGVFTFPSTGYWYIQLTAMARHNSDCSAIWVRIDQTSNNGGSWGHYAVGTGNINYVSGSWWYGGATCQHIFDITDTSNQKVRFHMSANDSAYIEANSGQQCTGFIALRLADT